jgi:aminoglycoside 3-N-acetyltransferase
VITSNGKDGKIFLRKWLRWPQNNFYNLVPLKHKIESLKARTFIFLDKHAPFTLQWLRSVKKRSDRFVLERKKSTGKIITKEKLVSDLQAAGIKKGDSVIVHSSLRRIGFVQNGSQTVIDALLETIGSEGTLLFPASPVEAHGKAYLESNPLFDARNTPSKMGSISEHFRKLKGIQRSLHPLESVCAMGPLAEYYTKGHFGQLTPYNINSPFARLAEKHGKILSIGVINLEHTCISMHASEDAVPDFKPDIYDHKVYEVKMIDMNGNTCTMRTKVHNPEWSLKRYPNGLVSLFEKENVMKRVKIGEAESLLFDAYLLKEVMIKYYLEKGISMYFPEGTKL